MGLLHKLDRLWLAPEILRGEKLSPSPKGDMYSLSIILHEIIHRQGPYNLSATHLPDVEYILNQIQKGSSWKSFNTDGFFRPQIKVTSSEHHQIYVTEVIFRFF